MEIGFAGLGRMGRPMARHLGVAGHRVVGFDLGMTPDDVPADLAVAGVELTDDVARLARTEVSVSMLPDAAATEAVLLGDRGLFRCSTPSHVHVVMGTVGAAAVRELARRGHAHGVAIADAPVSGSVSMAENATITAMIGAEPDVYHTVRPIIAAMTREQFHTGPVGSGSAAKLAVNLTLAALNQAVAEALLVATADGLDPRVFYDVLEASAVAAPYVTYKRATFLDPESADVAFPISLLYKDVGLGLELARRHELNLPLATSAGRVLEEAHDAGLAEHDMAEVLRLLGERYRRKER